MSSRQTVLDTKLVEIQTAGRTISGQNAAAEERVKVLEAWLAEVQLALEILMDELSMTDTKLCAELSVVKESLRVDKTRVGCLECKLTAEAEKGQQ